MKTVRELATLELTMTDDRVAVLTMNRPDRANSQTVGMFGDYHEAALTLRDSGARALILRGAGDKAFCAGFDLAEVEVISTMGMREFLKFQELATGGLAAIRHLPFPVVAAIHGPAVGGGLAVALAADIRLAAPSAKLSCAFVKVGLSAGELGTSWQLTRLIGYGRAAELAFTARVVEAEEAARIGLVNRIVPAERLFDEAFAFTTRLRADVRLTKRELQRGQEIPSHTIATG